MALNDVPLASQTLAATQNPIRQNFLTLGAITGNANPASSALNPTSGFNFIYLPVQGASPATTFPAGDIGLYSFLNPTSTRRELYINKTNNSGIVQIPATASILGVSTPGNATAGWTYLPSGLILQWRPFTSTAGGGTQAVALPITFPNQALNAQVTLRTVAPATAVVGTITTTTVNVAFTAGVVTQIFVFAVGY